MFNLIILMGYVTLSKYPHIFDAANSEITVLDACFGLDKNNMIALARIEQIDLEPRYVRFQAYDGELGYVYDLPSASDSILFDGMSRDILFWNSYMDTEDENYQYSSASFW